MNEQRVTVYQGSQPVQLQNAQRTVVLVPMLRETLPHGESHKRLGIIQMFFGALCVIMAIIGISIGYSDYYEQEGIYIDSLHSTGMYTGVFYIVAGLLGFLADRNNSKCLVMVCMLLNIIAALVTIIGFTFIGIELSILLPFSSFQKVKCGVLIVCFCIEFVTTIVHASFSCASFCGCCLPRVALSGQVIKPTAVQPLPQETIIPGQAYQLPQQQTMIAQQQPGQIAIQHPFVQNHFQQQSVIGQQQPGHVMAHQLVHNHPQPQFDDKNRQDDTMPAFNAEQDTSQLIPNENIPNNDPIDRPPPYSELSIGKL